MENNKTELEKKLAFVFPGQGSQFIGMGKDLSEKYTSAQNVFKEVEAAIGQKLTQIMWEGSEEELRLTEYTQPALLAVSCALLAVLETEFGFDITKTSYSAGHSLGEYSALVATKSLSVADAARLLQIRGRAMQTAVPVGQGAMAALLGAELSLVEEICDKVSGLCEIANDNAIGQIVISGEKNAIEESLLVSKEMGVKKAILLPVSAPFHCSLMEPAALKMQEALREVDIKKPVIPVISNIKACPFSDEEEIRSGLFKQITQRVRWRESINYMSEKGVQTYIECGSGKVLTQMLRRIVSGKTGLSLTELSALEVFAGSYLVS